LLFSATALYSADAKPGTLTCVGLYSETSDGYISARVPGKGDWVAVKVGDVLAANAELKINVDRDWIELVPAGNPSAVFEIVGPDSGELVKKVADILKGKPKTVAFPKGTADRFLWMLYNLFSGGLLLGAIFMATDYTTSPVTKIVQVVFGIGCGLITVLIRYFGIYPEGVCYAVLIMNILVVLIDKVTLPRRFGVIFKLNFRGGAK